MTTRYFDQDLLKLRGLLQDFIDGFGEGIVQFDADIDPGPENSSEFRQTSSLVLNLLPTLAFGLLINRS
jgi:hypothetical protein